MKLLSAIFARVAVLCTAVLVFGLGEARGLSAGTNAPLPNFDKRQSQAAVPATTASAVSSAAEASLRASVPDVKVERDELLGTPRLVSSPRGFLTGPNGIGKSVKSATSASFPIGDTNRATKAFLQEHRDLFGHGAEVLDAARVKRDFVTPRSGLHTMVWEQQVDKIGVFEGLLISHTTRNGELVSISSHFLPNAAQAATSGTANRSALQAAPVINASEALIRAARNIGEEILSGEVSTVKKPAIGDAELHQQWKAPKLKGVVEMHLVWLPMNGSAMRLCWEVILMSRARGEMFSILIDAQTGEALVRHGLTSYISDASYRVYTSDSPSPFSPGYATPSSGQPSVIPRVLVTTNAFDTTASPNGWINDGDNETVGNNVDAHTDHSGNDVIDLPRPQGSPFRVFDFDLDLSQDPYAYANASVVQLFYLCNVYHDKLYELGFTEAAGNFQADNFGNGGMGGDPVLADCQDGGGFDNANFSTPPDGSSGRMQMYIFAGPNPRRDGSLDAEVVFHEHTHGLSNRRVGGGVGISALQPSGMGEGWSDFYALCLLSEESDDPNGNYAAGGYASYKLNGLTQNYYYGIRHYPYTTDLTKNPFTFKDIDPTKISPHNGVPHSPIYPFSSFEADEVHHQGEVWCVTLWEARANLIAKYGFATGNQLILQIVTDGMNLSPANPTFLEARDAIIQADLVDNDGANFIELWAAFAKRGMGFFAHAPANYTTIGVIESYSLPDTLLIGPGNGFTAKGPVGGPFNTNSVNYSLADEGTNDLFWTIAASVPWLDVSVSSGSVTTAGPPVSVTVSLDAAASALAMGIYSGTVWFTNETTGIVQGRDFKLLVGQPDYFTEQFVEKPNDLHNQEFTFTPNGSADFYSVCRQPATSFPTDPSGGNQVFLTDDDYVFVPIDNDETVSLYGHISSYFYIGSNGYLTLDFGNSDFDASVETHFQQVRISGLFDDLDPGMGGEISWKQLPDRMAVTYTDISQYGLFNNNNFQIEMFFDGRIRVTYLQIDDAGGLAGLSAGAGVPDGFVSSDFDEFPTCLGASAPVLEARSGVDGGFALLLYGNIDSNYVVQCATSPIEPIDWTNLTSVTLTNSPQVIDGISCTNQMMIFRAYQP